MIDHLHELRERRASLQRRSAAERMRVAEYAAELAEKGAIVDRAVSVARGVPLQPVLLGVAAVVVFVGPGRLLGWAMRGVALVGMARRTAALLRNFSRP